MANTIDAPGQEPKKKWFQTTADRAKEAMGVAGDMRTAGQTAVADANAATNVALGEVSQTGVDMTVNPLAKSMTMRQEAGKLAAQNKADATDRSLSLKQQAIKAAGEATGAVKDAYNDAYAAIAAEAKRLGGFGGWMNKQEKDQFTRFKDAQLAQLDPKQAAQLSASFKNV
ncbi:MAG: hypothetical protein CMI60_04055 [Parvibaculum sp.]|jgi:hypothetical protein|nr:hypothetical protein [Parvibaculum sp.]